MGALPKAEQNRRFTYADYKTWELKEGERHELIRGEAFAMASPNRRHQTISREMCGQLYNYLNGKTCQMFAAPFDVRLFYDEEEGEDDDTVVQPDIMVVCDEGKIGDEGIRGAPDLVIEILSPSNTVFEMSEKRALYEDAGVREYWVVNPKDNEVTVHCLRNGGFFDRKTYESADTIPVDVLPGLGIDLERVFARG
ncbi:MAG: Uma2 family endonuclease [Treponema sp.]|nr:Uma2 family endonuclease [Treponema sp.]